MKTNKYIILFSLSLINLISTKALAGDIDFKWSELRAFISNNSYSSDNTALNNLGTADNIEKLKGFAGIGLEADAQFKPGIKVGTRIKGIWNSVYPPNHPTPATAYMSLSQFSGSLLLRGTIIEKESFLFDVSAELGLANTTIDVLTSGSGKASYDKTSNFFQRAGASLGIGSQSMKIYIEAGQEWHTLSGMNYTGTIGSNVSSIDLSGPYYAFGLIISGIPSWIKPGNITVGK